MVPSLLLPLGLLSAGPVALAHKPTFSEDFSGPEQAFVVDDPDVSIVVYQDITCELDQLWITFESEPGFEAYVQLGVPVIDRLDDYEPSVAVLAAGLPEAPGDLPFAVPDGMGALVFHGEDAAEPGTFYEEFTQTESWIWVEETVTLPEGGPVYLVGWDPGNQTGKLWLATGTVEDFTDVEVTDFLYWSEAVHDFHETGRYDVVEPHEEQVCDAAEPEAAADGGDATSGCQAVPLTGGLGAILMGLVAGVARREQPLPRS
jgi:hypothetical protein